MRQLRTLGMLDREPWAVAVLDAMMLDVRADDAKAGKRRDGFVGAQSFGVILVVSGFVVFTGWGLTHYDDSIPLPDRLSASIAFASVLAFMLMGASARIFVRDAEVHVVSFLFTFVVPVEEIVALQAENGLGIQVVSGRVITSMAFGSSIMAEFTGNRRSRRAAHRLTELCGPFTADLAPDPGPGTRHLAGGPDATWSKIRLGMLSLAGGLVAAAAASAVIQNALINR
jgi:hypothetical protein